MTTYTVITSLNQQYFDHCGRACLETFSRFWPDDIQMVVYNEDMMQPKKFKRISYLPWHVLGQDFLDFSNRTENSRVLQFAKKAFPIIHAMDTINTDRIIWLDADVATKILVNRQLLDLISNDRVLSTHYGVKHPWPSDLDPERISFSCETGFFILNTRHAMFRDFANLYKKYYLEDIGYNLRRFYDGEVYGAVVDAMEKQGAAMYELNPEQKHKTPIPRSIMAPYIQHFKAGVKDNITNEDILNSIVTEENHED